VITTFEPNSTIAWESRHNNGFARGEIKLYEQHERTHVILEFEYHLYRPRLQSIARVVSHLGFPSLTFDHGLGRIKEKIEADVNAGATT
jgi:hypothetical protein